MKNIKDVELFVFDLDGTVYIGERRTRRAYRLQALFRKARIRCGACRCQADTRGFRGNCLKPSVKTAALYPFSCFREKLPRICFLNPRSSPTISWIRSRIYTIEGINEGDAVKQGQLIGKMSDTQGRDKGKLFYRRFFVVGIWLYGVFIVGLDCGFVAAVKAGIGISAVVGNRKCNDRS